METKKTFTLKHLLCHKATLVVAGILALVIAGVSIFSKAQVAGPINPTPIDPNPVESGCPVTITNGDTHMIFTPFILPTITDWTIVFDNGYVRGFVPENLEFSRDNLTWYDTLEIDTLPEGGVPLFYVRLVGYPHPEYVMELHDLSYSALTDSITFTNPYDTSCHVTPPTGCPVTLDSINNTYRIGFICNRPTTPASQVSRTIVLEGLQFRSMLDQELEFSIDNMTWTDSIDLSTLRINPDQPPAVYVRDRQYPDARHTSVIYITSASCNLLGCSVTFLDPCDVSCQINDTDGDGIGDDEDNCVYVYNPGQENMDPVFLLGHNYQVMIDGTTGKPVPVDMPLPNGSIVTWDGLLKLSSTDSELSRDGVSRSNYVIFETAGENLGSVYVRNNETVAITEMLTISVFLRSSINFFTMEGEGDNVGNACDCDDDICTEGYDVNHNLICPLGDPACGVDTDGDGIGDDEDNCVYVPNPGQENMDACGNLPPSGECFLLMNTRPPSVQNFDINVNMGIREYIIQVIYDGEQYVTISSEDGVMFSRDQISWADNITYNIYEIQDGTQLFMTDQPNLRPKFLMIYMGKICLEGGVPTDCDYIGDACDCDDDICTEGYDVNHNLICPEGDPACVSDEDGDGIPDDEDECVYVPGTVEFNGCPSRLRVSVEEIDASTKPATHQDTALETKVFDASEGSCAYNIGIQPQNYEQIRNECTAENMKKETYSPNDGNKPRNLISDLVGLGVTPGTKLVLVESQPNTDGTHGYMGFDLPDMMDGESRDVGFNIVPGQELTYVQTSVFTKDSKGLWKSSRRAQVIKGTELQIFQPDYVLWNGTEEIYPFIFIADGDRAVDVCMEVPAGYEIVEPGVCTQELIQNEIKVIEFRAVDIGSPKKFNANAKIKVKHNGRTHNVNLKVESFNPKASQTARERIKALFQ